MIPSGLARKNLLVTGLPGVGKTTLIKKLAEALKSLHPVGFYTEEIREEGERKGFELVSLEEREVSSRTKGSEALTESVHTRWTSKALKIFLTPFRFSTPWPVSLSLMRSERWSVFLTDS